MNWTLIVDWMNYFSIVVVVVVAVIFAMLMHSFFVADVVYSMREVEEAECVRSHEFAAVVALVDMLVLQWVVQVWIDCCVVIDIAVVVVVVAVVDAAKVQVISFAIVEIVNQVVIFVAVAVDSVVNDYVVQLYVVVQLMMMLCVVHSIQQQQIVLYFAMVYVRWIVVLVLEDLHHLVPMLLKG